MSDDPKDENKKNEENKNIPNPPELNINLDKKDKIEKTPGRETLLSDIRKGKKLKKAEKNKANKGAQLPDALKKITARRAAYDDEEDDEPTIEDKKETVKIKPVESDKPENASFVKNEKTAGPVSGMQNDGPPPPPNLDNFGKEKKIHRKIKVEKKPVVESSLDMEAALKQKFMQKSKFAKPASKTMDDIVKDINDALDFAELNYSNAKECQNKIKLFIERNKENKEKASEEVIALINDIDDQKVKNIDLYLEEIEKKLEIDKQKEVEKTSISKENKKESVEIKPLKSSKEKKDVLITQKTAEQAPSMQTDGIPLPPDFKKFEEKNKKPVLKSKTDLKSELKKHLKDEEKGKESNQENKPITKVPTQINNEQVISKETVSDNTKTQNKLKDSTSDIEEQNQEKNKKAAPVENAEAVSNQENTHQSDNDIKQNKIEKDKQENKNLFNSYNKKNNIGYEIVKPTPIMEIKKSSIEILTEYLSEEINRVAHNIKAYFVNKKTIEIKMDTKNEDKVHISEKNENGENMLHFSTKKNFPEDQIVNVCALAVLSAKKTAVFDLSKTSENKRELVYAALEKAIKKDKKFENKAINEIIVGYEPKKKTPKMF